VYFRIPPFSLLSSGVFALKRINELIFLRAPWRERVMVFGKVMGGEVGVLPKTGVTAPHARGSS